jgi:hypothetical protein
MDSKTGGLFLQPDKKELEKFQKEIYDAKVELRARMDAIRKAQADEKENWIKEILTETLPKWAVEQVINMGRGWICRFFGIRVDKFRFDKEYAEQVIVFKRNKVVALKVFKWDDGQHLEGRRV